MCLSGQLIEAIIVSIPSRPRELNEARGLIGGRELIQVLRYMTSFDIFSYKSFEFLQNP
jgi:hypothetical protein